MQEARNARAQAYRRHRRQKRIWRNVLSVMACVVVFCTTYALILPAITMEKEAFCGIEAHAHKDDCYAQKVITVCDPAGGTELPVIHVHDEFCYDGETLICTLPELAGHVHTDACYTQVTYEAHAHGEECYTPVRGTLLCEVPEEEGHAHSDACYVPGETLLCTETEREGHTHGDACYSVSSELTCGTEECEGHTHGDSCYDCQTKLTCKTAETEGHTHSDSCYEATSKLTCKKNETKGHTHSDSCYVSKTQLVCDREETAGHSHGDKCYTEESKLTCKKEESKGHSHGADCYDAEGNLTCETPESEGHSHSGDCYTKEKKLTCDKKEKAAHTHDAGCYIETQSADCGLKEEPAHTHGADCYTEEKTLKCEKKEAPAHAHGAGCYTEEKTLKCEIPEKPSHAHSAECYTEKKTLICEVAEDPGHAHSGSCYEQVLGCGKEEKEGHAHSDECYEMVPELSCTKEEREETVVETVLECTLEQIAPHVHNDSCVDCTIANAAVHQHTAECISKTEEALVCELNEHAHTLACFSNPDADVETKADWDAMIANLELTGNWAEDVLIIAKSQLGYNESTKNYIVLEDGETMKGYTRYGAWYGGPYGDWCAMYVSFCLDYAGVEGFPQDCNCNNWVHTLIQRNRFRSAGQYDPQPADLIFFDPNQDGVSTHVGLVVEVDGNEVKTIEGNTSDTVAYRTYKLTDPDILGYGLLPRKLSAEDQAAVDAVIAMIDELPTFEEIEATVEAFMEAEDEAGEIAYLEELYPKVFAAYEAYMALEESLREFVTNRDKLMDLEYIWSATILAPGDHINVWFDGTCGGVYSYTGADDIRVTLRENAEGNYILPTMEEWEDRHPPQYDWDLRGWYNIDTGKYYEEGAAVPASEIANNHVFYADWTAHTYDVGKFNSQVSDTVSTNHFITTRLYDYSAIFNMYSMEPRDRSVSNSSHSETWYAVGTNNRGTKGTSVHNGGTETSMNFLMRDYNTTGLLSHPSNLTNNTSSGNANYDGGVAHNNNFNSGTNGISPGILATDNRILNRLFTTSGGVLGQEYVGTADHLFHYGTNESNAYTYGYYYYDSELNAASFNQHDARFYLYDYRERTTNAIESTGTANDPKYTDFLPFNSPYANIPNGVTVEQGTLSTTGETVPQYDSQNTDTTNHNHAGTNMWFGMRTDIEFFLPNTIGQQNNNNSLDFGNKGLLGNDLIFEFSGDDDVWVMVDDKLVLDLGGIHGVMSGVINFSKGTVTYDRAYTQSAEGNQNVDTLYDLLGGNLNSGLHTLTLYYLERGDSLSNCKVRFNLSPRYDLTIQKEDVLTQNLLNGATFEVFTDAACTEPAQLWTSREVYKTGKVDPTNVFTVTNGKASMFGFTAGSTYYLKETVAPSGYGNSAGGVSGIIVMKLDATGTSSYDVIADPNAPQGSNPAPGYTVRGFRVDHETHEAYIIITNGERETEVVDVSVRKIWEGGTGDYPDVIAYLLIDGVRRGSVTLNDNNNWQHTWKNLPKYTGDNLTTEVKYTVEEGLVPGYVGTVTPASETTITTTTWKQVNQFTDGKTYLIASDSGVITTGPGYIRWSNAADAMSKQLSDNDAAQWTATARTGGGFDLVSDSGIYLNFVSDNNGYMNAGEDGSRCAYPFYCQNNRLYARRNSTNYYLESMNAQHNTGNVTTTQNNGVAITLYEAEVTTQTINLPGTGYVLTNRPATDLATVTVNKTWTDYDGTTPIDPDVYEMLSVPVKLLEVEDSGENKVVKDTGLRAELNLKSNWRHVFQDLPRYKPDGTTPIKYTIAEDWQNDDWIPHYTVVDNQDGTFTITVNNIYNRMIDIPVEKIWDENLSPEFRKPITLELYKYTPNDTDQSLDRVADITLSESTDWKGKFTIMPPADGEVYYIYEPTDAYLVTYATPEKHYIGGKLTTVGRVTFSDDGNTITVTRVTNQPLQSLPETGGMGTTLYITGGVLLMIAAVMGLCYNSKRRRGKEEPVSSR